MKSEFFNPVKIIFGSIDLLPNYISGKTILLVTSAGFNTRGTVDRIKNILESNIVIVWDKVKSNPDISDIQAASESFRNIEIDVVIGLGGGSALDAAKVLANLVSNKNIRSLEYLLEHKSSLSNKYRLPLIAIPTTAGTGAEVTPFATIWDKRNYKKYSLPGDELFPDIALLDYNLTKTLSYEDTLYPALDSISHALESIWNENSGPISLIYSYRALEILSTSLKKVLDNPNNMEERSNLQKASVLAGVAISQTRTAVAHSISYPLTVRFGVPHGLACSFTLPNLIDKHLISADTHEYENLLLSIKELLLSFSLTQILKSYATVDQVLDTVQVKTQDERLSNYKWRQLYNPIEIASQAFN